MGQKMEEDHTPGGVAAREGEGRKEATPRYRRLFFLAVSSSCLVSLSPLFIMALINYYQYQKAFVEEVTHPIHLSISNLRRTMAFYFEERQAALRYVVHDRSFQELSSQESLARVFKNMQDNFDGIVDLGLVDEQGIQRAYVGPYTLKDRSYKHQSWFKEVLHKGVYISPVFMGYRKYPHFVIAVRHQQEGAGAYVLRATLNAAVFNSLLQGSALRSSWDAFIVDRRGVLQTPSRNFGGTLEKMTIPVPPPSEHTVVTEDDDGHGGVRVTGYGHVVESPYIVMVVAKRASLLTSWFALRNKLALFLAISAVLIVVVVLSGGAYMLNRLKEADARRMALLHQVEYTSKMASIGRLAAGVAHEINNPLAIINEKAGLLQDIIDMSPAFPERERFLRHVGPIQASVERCSRITRRLLRFAKHIDVRTETIDLGALIGEVLGFLDKESAYRSITVTVESDEDVPAIESDRGRLQQVFLNIINNAFAAVEDGGEVGIKVSRAGEEQVAVHIRDNGSGISEQNLSKIFDPFFTTKQKYGTGLGLSITYGIISKLGGKILVDSSEGVFTEFTVLLPVRTELKGGEDGRA